MTFTIPIEAIGFFIGVGIFLFGIVIGAHFAKENVQIEAQNRRLDEMLAMATRPDDRRIQYENERAVK